MEHPHNPLERDHSHRSLQPNNKPLHNWLAVNYARPSPISDRGELILFKPADRNALVRALRTHAPQADFDFFPSIT